MYTYTHNNLVKSLLFITLTFLLATGLSAQTTTPDSTKKTTDTLYQQVQISFIPFFGTNGTNAGNTINRFSINVLAGHSMGTNGFEVGSIANTNKANMRGFQAAGIANVVGGRVKGFQAAGFTNIVGKGVDGFQSAGFINVVNGPVKGFQAAGFSNVNAGKTDGFQASGFANINGGNSKGFQAAGFANINADTTIGGTFAGFINIVKQHRAGIMAAGSINIAQYKSNGLQVAGLFNYADTIRHAVQIAGLFNANRKGSPNAQIAGLFNITKNLKGLQLAPFNFADTVSQGTPIGFLSFVRTGVHQLEISFDELRYLNLAFRTGTRQFHNIITAGIVPQASDSLKWSYGYGIGTSAILSKRLNLDVDLTASQINHGKYFDNLNILSKLYIGVEYAIAKKVKVAAGPVLNVFLVDTEASGYTSYFKNLAPYDLYSHQFNNGLNIKGWIGGKVAFRFL